MWGYCLTPRDKATTRGTALCRQCVQVCGGISRVLVGKACRLRQLSGERLMWQMFCLCSVLSRTGTSRGQAVSVQREDKVVYQKSKWKDTVVFELNLSTFWISSLIKLEFNPLIQSSHIHFTSVYFHIFIQEPVNDLYFLGLLHLSENVC